MDVRRADQLDPILEHGGTCRSYHMIPKGSMFNTRGCWLEFVGEFELVEGAHLEPHRHDTDEFYYMLAGAARMRIGDEEQDVLPGDLIHIPRNAVHSIWPVRGSSFRAFAFAVSYQQPDVDPVPAPFDH